MPCAPVCSPFDGAVTELLAIVFVLGLLHEFDYWDWRRRRKAARAARTERRESREEDA